MSLLEWIYLFFSTAVDTIVVLLVLTIPIGPIDFERAVRAAVALGVSFLLKLVLAKGVTNSFFYAVRLAYADVTLVLPFVGLTLLALSRKRTVQPAVKRLAILALAGLPIGIYATYIEPFRLTVERTEVPIHPARAGEDELRVAVLADIQAVEVFEHHREAVRRAMAFEPHLILLPGDLLQAKDEESFLRVQADFRELLLPLEAPLGVWFVIGNTDWPGLVPRILEGTQVRILKNEWVVREHGDRRVVIGGSGMNWRDHDTRQFVLELEELASSETGGDDIRILLSHYPDVAHYLATDSRVDLVVAGHTHGGQVQIPGFGPPITLSTIPRRIAAGGLHELDGNSVYVSRGLGWEGGSAPRMRFLAPPELSLLTFVDD